VDGAHYFTVEGTMKGGTGARRPPRAAIEDFEAWARDEGLFAAAPRYLDGVVTPHAYPVYRTDNVRAVRDLKSRLESEGVVLAGRQGDFNYLSSSDAAGDAARVARAFLAQRYP
jgi:hypothetical protein